MKDEEMNMDQILRKYLPRADKEEMEAAGERVLQRIRAMKFGGAQPELSSEFDQLVLMATHLLQGRGESVSITEKVEELTGKRQWIGSVYGALERLENRGLISSSNERSFKLTAAGEHVLTQLRTAATGLEDALGDSV